MRRRAGCSCSDRMAPIEVMTIFNKGRRRHHVGSRDGVAFVAQREGLARIDSHSRCGPAVGAGWHQPCRTTSPTLRQKLVGVQAIADGARGWALARSQGGSHDSGDDVPLPRGDAPISPLCAANAALLSRGRRRRRRATVWTSAGSLGPESSRPSIQSLLVFSSSFRNVVGDV